MASCIAIIGIGYCAGRLGLVAKEGGRGIGQFLGNFSLPALLFRQMVTLDFEEVNWTFVIGVLGELPLARTCTCPLQVRC